MAVGFSAQSLIALMILVLALCAKLTLQCVTPFPKQGTENQTVPSAMLVVNTSKMVQDFTEFGINDMRGQHHDSVDADHPGVWHAVGSASG